MSLRDFQSAAIALYLDERLRASFFASPSSGVPGFRLAPAERRALAGLDRARLEAYCLGLAVKRAEHAAAVRRSKKRRMR